MKLNNINRDINSTAKSEIKEVRSENTNKLNTILNPLQGVDIKSDIYSFNELKNVKENFDNYMKSCENYILYLLHQSFMCDEEQKKFFKSMVGRFYDLPERFWKYYWMEPPPAHLMSEALWPKQHGSFFSPDHRPGTTPRQPMCSRTPESPELTAELNYKA